MSVYYAVVPSHGHYDSDEPVKPDTVSKSLERARRLAGRGRRVVETTEPSRRTASWMGHELDRIRDA